jgi:hypothetical protein
MLGAMLKWLVHGDAPEQPRREPTTREALLEARDKLKRQIQILSNPSGVKYGHPDNTSLIKDLSAELEAIEESLAELEPHDAEREGRPD